MGRWGWQEYLKVKTEDWDHKLSHLVHQTDILAPDEALARYKSPEYAQVLANEMIPWMRNKLNTDNLIDTLFDKCRALETDPMNDNVLDPKYNTIILGALVMRTVATIRDQDLKHLRKLVPDNKCNAQYA
ncbi:hypothetical protein N7481_003099 [Penicillium waksmanii]|uniref:uncharacterized protein n=1 Tax=Penicillium waksmanii TaxID=69791 RepID=UPI0025494F40|nr:uncharacterized protein N7481_003099 [Penicillium waksmanii]KAJ5987889.1 hypothetical protein N7481_003099 [Penicillium waksmanii]